MNKTKAAKKGSVKMSGSSSSSAFGGKIQGKVSKTPVQKGVSTGTMLKSGRRGK